MHAYRLIAATLLMPIVLSIVGDGHESQFRKEACLRRALFVLRTEIDQFTLDHQRPPESLSELVRGGYLKKLPKDPFTGRNDTWKLTETGDDVYSSTYSGIATDGTGYSSW
jgi:general secretion pathway protein G